MRLAIIGSAMGLVMFLVASWVVSAGFNAQRPQTDQPRLVQNGRQKELGSIGPGQVVDAAFNVTNEGTAHLVLKPRQTALDGDAKERPIVLAPGETKTIHVQTQTYILGRCKKEFWFTTNDLRAPCIRFVITATVTGRRRSDLPNEILGEDDLQDPN